MLALSLYEENKESTRQDNKLMFKCIDVFGSGGLLGLVPTRMLFLISVEVWYMYMYARFPIYACIIVVS